MFRPGRDPGDDPERLPRGRVAALLDTRDIRMFDYGPLFADPFWQSIRSHVDRLAAKEGLEVECIKMPKGYRKEDRIREIVAKRGNHPGLVHIFSVDGALFVIPAMARQANLSAINRRAYGLPGFVETKKVRACSPPDTNTKAPPGF